MSGVSAKPRVAIVGAGNLAGALAVSLRAAGYRIEEIISRDAPASLRRARRLAREVQAPAVTAAQARIRAEVVWLCIPDSAIRNAAQALLKATNWKWKIALHSSGALTSDELAVLQKRGAEVASAHPLMTFVKSSPPALAGVPFAIEGNPKAVRTARRIVTDLGGQAFSIRKHEKELYHAWGMFVSPLLTALLACSEEVAVAAGVNKRAARQRMLPILRQTLDNYARLGAPESFSGPIARGDVATVERHLKVLQGLRGVRELYIALAKAAMRHLPAKNRTALQKILKDRTRK